MLHYDVFLSHNSADKPTVEALARRLQAEGVAVFLDKWHLVPGEPWQEALEGALAESQTVAVFVGPSEISPWENEEMRAALEEVVQDGSRRVIPVLLPGAPDQRDRSLPRFLRRRTWVDFRAGLDDERTLQRLVSGIRGEAPGAGNEPLDPSNLRKTWRPLEYEPEGIYCPYGPFYMGGSPHDPHAEAWELPGSRIELPAFFIGTYPVTNRQYGAFVQASGHEAPRVNWAGRRPRKDKLEHPVVDVNWYDACAYCAWLSERTGRRYRLPSEAEWEKAARGADGPRIYPWGDTWQAGRCNHDRGETTEVSAYPPQGPLGCCDMVGNVREWTTTIWGDHSHEAQSDYPYPWKDDGRDALGPDARRDTRYRICRGGSYADGPPRLRCSARDWASPEARSPRTGFRVVMEIGEQGGQT